MNCILSAIVGIVLCGNTMVIQAGSGGRVSDHSRLFIEAVDKNMRVEIRGYCASACTLALLFDPKRLCIDPDAQLGFHQMSLPGGKRADEQTDRFFDMLPPSVRAHLQPLAVKIQWMSGREIKEFPPCPLQTTPIMVR